MTNLRDTLVASALAWEKAFGVAPTSPAQSRNTTPRC